MNPRLDFRGHEPEYRHFVTDRFSGLMPYHFERRRFRPFWALLATCVCLGVAALTLFVIQVVR